MYRRVLILLIVLSFATVCYGFECTPPNCSGNGCSNNVNSQANQGQEQVLYDGSVHQIVSKAGKVPRGFALPGNITFPGFVNHFERALPTGNVFRLGNILKFQKTFSSEELTRIKGKEKFDVKVKDIKNYKIQSSKIDVYLNLEDVSYFTKHFELIGFIVVKGKNCSNTSLGAMGAAGEEACKIGADAILITGEGASRIIKATGWGLMIGNSVVSISSDEKISNISVGGIGYASSKAGYKHIPWLQIMVLKDK